MKSFNGLDEVVTTEDNSGVPDRLSGDIRPLSALDYHDQKAGFGYSITSSAMATSPGGMSRPSVLAVLRLMASS
jgi:hypothetical protein